MRIGYFADGVWAQKALRLLLDDGDFDVAFVCARCGNPDAVLREMAGSNGIPFLCHPRINSEEFHQQLLPSACDIFVSMSFDQIFRPETLAIPPMETINCHAGKLPFYRGRNILNWALINDERDFGITVHYIDPGIDTGDIILQETYPITDQDDYSTLLRVAQEECPLLLHRALRLIHEGQARRIVQDTIDPVGLYCSVRGMGDEILNWNQSSRDVFNFVRAICRPGPMARTFCGDREVCINRVKEVPGAPSYKGVPGAVLCKNNDGSLLVKTADSFVRLVEFSHDSKPPRVGQRLKQRPEGRS